MTAKAQQQHSDTLESVCGELYWTSKDHLQSTSVKLSQQGDRESEGLCPDNKLFGNKLGALHCIALHTLEILGLG